MDFGLARLNPDGSLDTTFDGDGKVSTSLSPLNDAAFRLALQDDGRILVAGRTVGTKPGAAIVRYNTDGSLDPSFGQAGKVLTSLGPGVTSIRRIDVLRENRILISGTYTENGNSDFAALRYNWEGSLDPTFDQDGKVIIPVGTGNDTGRGMAVQSDGKVIIAGPSSNGINDDFGVVRINNTVSVSSRRDVNKDRRVTVADFQFVLSRMSCKVLLNNIAIPAAESIGEDEDFLGLDSIMPLLVTTTSAKPSLEEPRASASTSYILPRWTGMDYSVPRANELVSSKQTDQIAASIGPARPVESAPVAFESIDEYFTQLGKRKKGKSKG